MELGKWAKSEPLSQYAIQRMWFVGKGFFAGMLNSNDAASRLIAKGAVLFRGNVVQVLPYAPSFDPESL